MYANFLGKFFTEATEAMADIKKQKTEKNEILEELTFELKEKTRKTKVLQVQDHHTFYKIEN